VVGKLTTIEGLSIPDRDSRLFRGVYEFLAEWAEKQSLIGIQGYFEGYSVDRTYAIDCDFRRCDYQDLGKSTFEPPSTGRKPLRPYPISHPCVSPDYLSTGESADLGSMGRRGNLSTPPFFFYPTPTPPRGYTKFEHEAIASRLQPIRHPLHREVILSLNCSTARVSPTLCSIRTADLSQTGVGYHLCR
jgi:hypothetical protein